jgi:hypothetical protein
MKHAILKYLTWGAIIYMLSICASCGTSRVDKCKKAFEVLKENGCLTQDTTRKDTTIYRTTYKDTTILIKKDSVGTSVTNPCDEKGKLKPINKTFKSGRATVNLKSDTAKNEITATATCDELELKLKQKETVIENYRETIIKNSYDIPLNWRDYLKEIWWIIPACLGVGLIFGLYLRR